MREWIPINIPVLGEEEIRLVVEVLKTRKLTERTGSGFYVSQFEQKFAKLNDVKYAIAVSSGTAALHAALLAIKMRKGGDVIIPSFTFVAVAEAVVMAGGKPVFADIDLDTYCISLESIEECISDRTEAIVPTHLFGAMCDMDPILELARKRDIAIIEDAAQAHGAEYKGKKAGSLGHMGCFSFYTTKIITTGEGGMVVTNESEYARALRAIRVHGDVRGYRSVMLGHNYRMGEIQGAIGLAQLSKLPAFLEARRRNAEVLTDKLKDIDKLQLPIEVEGIRHSWYTYTVRLKGATTGIRNRLVERLRGKKIEAVVYYPLPIHKMPYYRKNFPCDRHLRNSEKASRQVFSLPVHPKVTEDDIDYVANTVRKLVKR